jgi:hypothetical protein
MKTIWKFTLKITDFQSINLPKESQLLTVQIQKGVPCIWALVNPNKKKEEIQIRIFGTGHPIEENFNGKYVGTFQVEEGLLIFHVFIV